MRNYHITTELYNWEANIFWKVSKYANVITCVHALFLLVYDV